MNTRGTSLYGASNQDQAEIARDKRMRDAAPEMYTALRDLLWAIEEKEPTDLWCVYARKALDKAEGRS